MSKKETAAAAPKMNSKQRKAAEKAAKAEAASKAAATNQTPAETPAPAKKTATATSSITSAMPPLPKLPKSGSGSRARKEKPVKDCTCGCGGKTTGAWVPGHDARARGWAIRIERDVIKMSDVPENERPGAKFMLAERKAKGLTGKGITLAKGNTTEDATEGEQEKSDIDVQVEAAIADGMSPEAAAGLRESLEAAAAANQ